MDSQLRRTVLACLAFVFLVGCGGGGGGGTENVTQGPGPFVLDADTVALWHFDENAGQTASDASPNNFHLSLGPTTAIEVSDPVWFAGKFNSCLRYTATQSDHATLNHSAALQLPAASVEFWYRSTLNAGVLFAAGSICFRLQWESSGLWFGIGDDSNWNDMTLDSSWTATICNGQWHYIAATYDNAMLRIYVDGVERGSGAATRTLAPINDFHVGGRPQNTFATGEIDEVRFSSKTRTPTEIANYWTLNQP